MPLEKVGAITLFVEDAARSKEWYAKVFERPLAFEDDVSAAFQFGNMIVNLLAVGEAHGLIEPAAVGASGAGARFQFTIWVADVDAACVELRTKGIDLINGPIDRVWGQRTACFADPDGHIWEIAQSLG
jgi:lactoylglutathione lyase